MTNTTDWKPSKKMVEVAYHYLPDMLEDAGYKILIAVRPLIIAEARPEIEAAERERIAKHFDNPGAYQEVARIIRALKDKPSTRWVVGWKAADLKITFYDEEGPDKP